MLLECVAVARFGKRNRRSVPENVEWDIDTKEYLIYILEMTFFFEVM